MKWSTGANRFRSQVQGTLIRTRKCSYKSDFVSITPHNQQTTTIPHIKILYRNELDFSVLLIAFTCRARVDKARIIIFIKKSHFLALNAIEISLKGNKWKTLLGDLYLAFYTFCRALCSFHHLFSFLISVLMEKKASPIYIQQVSNSYLFYFCKIILLLY